MFLFKDILVQKQHEIRGIDSTLQNNKTFSNVRKQQKIRGIDST